ncbi:glycosyltransferase [Marinomonas communis]|uniref:glycosyltransferase n=1 Tax=Marinomonas communis TaxID=28254 RepID=UPI001D196D66|nr:glycosyltransferase [Marinomonas communis]MCC4275239.1 glycosyltransferase [Marinomonas communis]
MTYIIVLNYNGAKDTVECVRSILNLDYSGFKIIVVDNNSKDGCFELLKESLMNDITLGMNNSMSNYSDGDFSDISLSYFSEDELSEGFNLTEKVSFISSERNGGFSAGNNIGLKLAFSQFDFEYAWILNNDVVVSRDSLQKLIEFKSDKKLGVVGSKIRMYEDSDILQGVGATYSKFTGRVRLVGEGEKDLEDVKDIDFVIGASMFVSKAFLHDVGFLSEDYFLYFEELDWTTRGKEYGYSTKPCLESVIYHKVGASIGSSNDPKKKSLFSDYWYLRNKKVFTKKFYPNYMFFIYFSYILNSLNRLLRGDLRASVQCFEIMLSLRKNPNEESFFLRQLKSIFIYFFNLIYPVVPFFSVKRIVLRAWGIDLGKGSSIHSPVKFYGKGCLKVGDNSVINSGCHLDNRKNIFIGDNVSVAHDVRIFTLGHDVNDSWFSACGKDVKINDRVVIFVGAMIMPGVELGEGVVVYPGSVVTKDVPPYAIVAGVPAKIVGQRSRDLKYTINYNYWFAS